MRRPACRGTAALVAGTLALAGVIARPTTDLGAVRTASAVTAAGSAASSSSGSASGSHGQPATAGSTPGLNAGSASGSHGQPATAGSTSGLNAGSASGSHGGRPAAAGVGSSSTPTEGPLQLAGTSGASTNWSGYAATGATFTAAKATWRQPPADCSALAQGEVTLAGFWVGLDGYSSATVEQIGTQTDCEGPTPVYYAWFELFPQRLRLLSAASHPLHAGDLIHAEVTQNRLRLQDVTAGWTELTPFSSATLSFSSAEWVAESPSGSLTDFGSISLTSATASTTAAAGQQIDSGSWALHKIDLSGGTAASATAATGAITDGPSGSAFQVRWQHG